MTACQVSGVENVNERWVCCKEAGCERVRVRLGGVGPERRCSITVKRLERGDMQKTNEHEKEVGNM